LNRARVAESPKKSRIRESLKNKPGLTHAIPTPDIAGILRTGQQAMKASAMESAVKHHQEGDLTKAAQLYELVLKTDPHNPDAMHLLGVVSLQGGDASKAIRLIRNAIAIKDADWLSWFNLGIAHRTLGDVENAVSSYRRAVSLNPQASEVWFNMGNALFSASRYREAVDAFFQAAAVRPDYDDAHTNLGISLEHLKKSGGDVAPLIQAWEDRHPQNPVVRHMKAALRSVTTDRCSDDFLRSHFDRFSGNFDERLNDLSYQVHLLARRSVDGLPLAWGGLSILDAGCGTGLCGPLFRPLAKRMVGVDISEGMLARARSKNIYDELAVSELTAFLKQTDEKFDVIVAADVLSYFGRLDPVFENLPRVLKQRGVFISSVELASEGEGSEINPNGRYRHGKPYVNDVARACGFTLVREVADMGRMEFGSPVTFLVSVFRLEAG
jgi:predicted TPR repeat methyltransferase